MLEREARDRNQLGHFLPGHSIQPQGPRFTKGALQAIMDDLLGEYSLDSLKRLYEDKEALGKVSVAKAMVIQRIMDALERGGGQDFDRIMDRAHGKLTPETQVNVQINTFSSAQDDEILDRYMQRRMKDVTP